MEKILEEVLNPKYLPWQVSLILLAIYIFYKVVGEKLYEKALSHNFELKKLEYQNILQQQSKFVEKKIEVETIKLNKVMPLFEEINSSIVEHRMLYRTYLHWVVNKVNTLEYCGKNLDEKRLSIDCKLISQINSVAIYLPKEFRSLLFRLRKIVSCCLINPKDLYLSIHASQEHRPLEIAESASDIYDDLIACYYDMVAAYLSLSADYKNYSEIIENNNLSSELLSTREGATYHFAESKILYHEYDGN